MPATWPMNMCVGLLMLANGANAQNDTRGLMPLPQQVVWNTGSFIVDQNVEITIEGHDDERVRSAVARLQNGIFWETGIDLGARNPASKPSRAIRLICRTPGADVQFLGEDESYTLTVDPNQVTIEATTPLGIMRGCATLAQLVEHNASGPNLPAVKIQDKPRFPWRGLLIDPCRHWMPIDVLKRNIQGMAAVKLNVLHWHLTEDQAFRIESKRYPELHEKGSKGRYYTQAEVKHIIAFARNHGIRVVPEFDMPGHTASWLVGRPELAAHAGPYAISNRWGVMEASFDPTKDSTYELLDGFLGEMAALFPDAYMHIGGDEVEGTWWKDNKDIQAFMSKNSMKDIHDLQAHFNGRVCSILNKHDKVMIGWDEIIHPDLPPSCLIQSWRGRDGLEAAARAGRKAILSNGYYLDHMRRASFHYGIDPVGPDDNFGDAVLGGEACMWSEYVSAETVDSRIWPRLAAIAERLWSPSDVTNIDDMYRRLSITSLRLEQWGLRHRSNFVTMIRRLAGNRNTKPLTELCRILEPVKFYQRSAAGGYTTTTPLNRIVDIARPESRTAREFEKQVDRFLTSGMPRDQRMNIQETLERWQRLSHELKAWQASSPQFDEVEPVTRNVSRVAGFGLEALEWLTDDRIATDEWLESANQFIDFAAKAQAEVDIAIIPSIRKLVRAASGFAQTHGMAFGLHGKRHTFAGVNFWQAMHMGMAGEIGDRKRLRAELDFLQSIGVTNLRIWASAEGPDSEPYRIKPCLMRSPGNYDEDVLDGLDFLIAEIAKRDMHAVVVLTNFWEWSGGMAQYVSWNNGTKIPYPAENDWREFTAYATQFYEHETCQEQYRKHIKHIVTRFNKRTNRHYHSEPAIFAWELANEPRYYPIKWINDTSRFIKRLDPNHMVTTGIEGDIACPFFKTHESEFVDYTTVHIWAQNWGWFNPKDESTYDEAEKKALDYLDKHITQSTRLRKPLVLEEFGLSRDWTDHQDYHDPRSGVLYRNRLYRALGSKLVASAANGPSAGFNIWAWAGAAKPGDSWIGDPPHEKPGWYSVYQTDETTLQIMQAIAEELRLLSAD